MTESLSLLDVSDLSKILKIGMKSIYVRSCQAPQELPPRIKLPGSRSLRWHPLVVKRWLDEQAGLLSEPIVAATVLPKRRPGRPTKAEQFEKQRGGGR